MANLTTIAATVAIETPIRPALGTRARPKFFNVGRPAVAVTDLLAFDDILIFFEERKTSKLNLQ